MSAYCRTAPGHRWHGPYHDTEYGFPLRDDRGLFERFVLEINQAGLSWLTVLQKRANFALAYEGYSLEKVAAYGEADRQRLLADVGIIRNRLKIEAVIHNAGRLLKIQEQAGSFAAWLDQRHPLELDGWVRLFKSQFKFVGPEIVGEFLMSTGYLPGAHAADCQVFARIAALAPPWAESPLGGKNSES